MPDPGAVAACFDIRGELTATESYGAGHINDSYRLTYAERGVSTRYLLQRINNAIFHDPPRLMENIQRVTDHIAARWQAAGVPDGSRRGLRLVTARAGRPYHQDAAGAYWRMYHFIEHTTAREAPQTPAQAEQAGRAYGQFQQLLANLPPPRLHDTIPDFHNTPLRYATLDRAIAADAHRRAATAKAEIDFAQHRRPLATVLLDLHRRGQIPERAVHNDAKLSNVLLDEKTSEGLCVVDLDIVMPGLSLYDFGDMVRSMTCPAAEDEPDLTKVAVQPPLFEALARGYLATAGALLTSIERQHLIVAGKLITLEQGVRFLTDYLNGDTYYKTHRPNQNLDRTRVQFKLVESLEQSEEVLRRALP